MNKHIITGLAVAAITASIFAPAAFADTTCTTNYGGGTTCNSTNLTINKTVQDPQSGNFVDNLGVNDSKFTSGQTVTFHITVTNNGSGNISDVVLTDVLPQFMNFSSGPGSFNGSTNTLTDDLGGLNAGQSATITVQGTVSGNISTGTTCLTNQSTATGAGQTVQDNASFCIQNGVTKGGLPVFPAPKVTSTPPTGPEAMSFISLISAFGLGSFLKKRSSK